MALFNLTGTQCGKLIFYAIFFCQIKVGQFNRKFNFNKFSLLNLEWGEVGLNPNLVSSLTKTLVRAKVEVWVELDNSITASKNEVEDVEQFLKSCTNHNPICMKCKMYDNFSKVYVEYFLKVVDVIK